MPINPLPESTVRAIGSSLVLNDACSVVKELVDNSLDARATSISIEISLNALDIIQIKDNGIGISPDDRSLVCRRNFTSKVESFEDVKRLGGSSLGFRGQALASVAELSSSLLITTRIGGEAVGTRLQYDRHGELASSETASHPVGSTVRIQDFLKNVPVRRQTVAKVSAKTLTAIKKILQAYAFAKPSVRLFLKVLKGKNEKQNWTYGAKAGATLHDVALNVCGQSLASQCAIEREDSAWEANDKSDSTAAIDQDLDVFHLQAFMPRQDADFSKINNGGQHISIDGRPISSTRGFGRDVVKIYKSYIKGAAQNSAVGMTDPFLCMHIQCPPQSYDVNIEPAKDEVLFAESDSILTSIEALFKRVYGVLPGSEHLSSSTKRREHTHRKESETTFDLLLAKRTDPDNVLPNEVTSTDKLMHDPNTHQGGHVDAIDAYRNMSSFSNDDLGPIQGICDGFEEDIDEGEISDPLVTNPWSLAKLHVSVSRPRIFRQTSDAVLEGSDLPYGSASDSTPTSHQQTNTHWGLCNAAQTLPSPIRSSSPPPSYQNPGPPKTPWNRSRFHEDDEIEPPNIRRGASTVSASNLERTPLDMWIRNPASQGIISPISQSSDHAPTSDGRFAPPSIQSARRLHPRLDSVEASPERYGSQPRQAGRSGIIKPFVSPFKTSPRATGTNDTFQTSSQTLTNPQVRSLLQDTSQQGQSNQSDLEEIMEFEHRKKATQQAQRQSRLAKLQQSTLSTSMPPSHNFEDPCLVSQIAGRSFGQNPYQNRYLAAKSALAKTIEPVSRALEDAAPMLRADTPHLQTSIPPSDPRHRLFLPKAKVSRTKSSLLPLESVPLGKELHDIRLKVLVSDAYPRPACSETTTDPPVSAANKDTRALMQDDKGRSWFDLRKIYAPQKRNGMEDHSADLEGNISEAWSNGDISASTSEIQRWEQRIKDLIGTCQTARARDADGTDNAGRSGQPSNVAVDLFRRLKSFVETLVAENSDIAVGIPLSEDQSRWPPMVPSS